MWWGGWTEKKKPRMSHRLLTLGTWCHPKRYSSVPRPWVSANCKLSNNFGTPDRKLSARHINTPRPIDYQHLLQRNHTSTPQIWTALGSNKNYCRAGFFFFSNYIPRWWKIGTRPQTNTREPWDWGSALTAWIKGRIGNVYSHLLPHTFRDTYPISAKGVGEKKLKSYQRLWRWDIQLCPVGMWLWSWISKASLESAR